MYFPFMLVGLLLIPVLINTLFKKVESNITLSFLGILFSLLYCWSYIVPTLIVLEIDFVSYMAADVVWEITLAMSSFLSILLYNPCANVLDKVAKREL